MREKNKKRILAGLLLLLLAAANVVLIRQLFSIFEKSESGRVESMPLSDTGVLSVPVREGQDELIQTFFSVVDDMRKVGIWFAPEAAGSLVELSLYDNSTGEEFYETKEVRLEGGRLELELEHPIQGRNGNEFYLKIVPLQSSGNGIQLCSALGNYPDNHLLVNGREMENDIALSQYAGADAVEVESMPLSDTGELTVPVREGQDELIQTFFSVVDDMRKVGIWFAPEAAGSLVELSLYDNSTGEEFYETKEVRLEGGQLELELEHPIQGRNGNEFYLKIVPLQSNSNGIQLYSTSGNYPDNHLLVNGQELESDIAMSQYMRQDVTLAVLIILTVFLPVDLFCCFEVIHALRKGGKNW